MENKQATTLAEIAIWMENTRPSRKQRIYGVLWGEKRLSKTKKKVKIKQVYNFLKMYIQINKIH